MKLIPLKALSFGAESLFSEPVKYGKSRVAGSKKVTHIMHSRSCKMPGQTTIFKTNFKNNLDFNILLKINQKISDFKNKSFSDLSKKIGRAARITSTEDFTYYQYSPHDDDTFELVLNAAYRHVYGNLNPMESERSRDAERRLRNGDINIRDFIRYLVKSPFYRFHYLESVNQQRCIELTFKHILGRPPLSQQELIKHIQLMDQIGFEGHIDALIDSSEYEEIFGADTIPYIRGWDSPLGMKTSCFNHIAALSKSFATSDNAIHRRNTSSNAVSGKSQLMKSLVSGIANSINITEIFDQDFKPKTNEP